MTYHPPFASERLGEVVFNGCTVRSTLMTRASASFGEALQNADHEPLDAKAIHAYAESLEPGPPTQSRGYNTFDVQTWIDKRDPNAFDVPSWDNPRQRLRIQFPEYKKRIIAGECGTLAGNAARVKDAKSPLHKFVADVGHAIHVNDGDANGAYIFDPMGLPVDSYNGDKVPWKDLEEFASEFSKPNGFVFTSLIARGSQTAAAQVQRKLDKAAAQVKAQGALIDAADAKIVALTKDRDAALAAQKTAEDALAPCEAAGADLTAKLADRDALIATQVMSLADLTQKNTDLKAALDNTVTAYNACDAEVVDLRAQLAACQSGADLTAANAKVADLQAQLKTCQDSLNGANTSLGLYQRMFAFLKRFIGRAP